MTHLVYIPSKLRACNTKLNGGSRLPYVWMDAKVHERSSKHSLGAPNEGKIRVVFDNTSRRSKSRVIPDQLTVEISSELWNSYSPSRRQSFKNMFTNPNAFFYRNRPPGDPQRCGSFTKEEEEQFLERIKYFRKLGISDGLWGLFAVPLKGRLGYQCSNFYRLMVQEGKIKESNYEMESDGKLRFIQGGGRQVPKESEEILVKEAIDFVNSCLNGNLSAEISGPITLGRDGEMHNYKRAKKMIDASFCSGDVIEIKSVIKRDPCARESPPPSMNKGGRSESSADLYLSTGEDDEMSVLQYAKDPITGIPMVLPYMDTTTGIVLDLSTWRRVIEKQEIFADSRAESISDLVKMTKRNFSRYWRDIVNVTW